MEKKNMMQRINTVLEGERNALIDRINDVGMKNLQKDGEYHYLLGKVEALEQARAIMRDGIDSLAHEIRDLISESRQQ